MTNGKSIGRWAGLVYLIVVVTGFFSLGYVPGKIAAPGNPQAMLDNIVAHETLFRAGIGAFMVEQVAFLVLPLLLFRLLEGAHRGVAVTMVALAAVSVPIALVGVAHRLDALLFLTDADFVGVLGADTSHAMAWLSLKAYGRDIFMASLFWGLWLLPFGYLGVKSGLLPKVLGTLLMFGGVGYLLDVSCDLLLPGYAAMPLSNYTILPAALGEVGSCLWMLAVGARAHSGEPPVPARSPI
jgi:hypothetical protein